MKNSLHTKSIYFIDHTVVLPLNTNICTITHCTQVSQDLTDAPKKCIPLMPVLFVPDLLCQLQLSPEDLVLHLNTLTSSRIVNREILLYVVDIVIKYLLDDETLEQ